MAIKLFSPHEPPEHKPCSPLDYPATLRDVLASEARIVTAIQGLAGAGGDAGKISDLSAQLKAHTDELQNAISAATTGGQ